MQPPLLSVVQPTDNSLRFRFLQRFPSLSMRLLYIAAILLCLHVTLSSLPLLSQPYVEGGDTRYRFAQMYLGADVQYIPAGGTTFGASPADPVTIPGRITPRLTIGGLHFWGHADFYVTFPIPPSGPDVESEGIHSLFSTGIETGARLYPWRLEDGGVRPFAGISWSVMNYLQREEEGEWGPTLFRHRVPLHGGLSWMIGPALIELEGMWIPGTDLRYPSSRTESAALSLPNTALRLGINYVFETTLGAEYAEQNGAIEGTRRRMDSAGQLDTWMVGIGPSAAFTLGGSSYLRNERNYLDNIPPSTPFPDIGLGYYFHRLDAALNLSWRPISQTQEAYGLDLDLGRTALWLEAYKFLFDYNGFVPFLGLGFGREWLSVRETDRGNVTAHLEDVGWRPGIIFGWDIRPTPVDWFTLRTNLRYAPGASLATPSGDHIAFDQLEFNFIQFVFYPDRFFGL